MGDVDERLALALSQAKHVEREVRLLKGMLKGVQRELANLEPASGQEGSNAAEDQDQR